MQLNSEKFTTIKTSQSTHKTRSIRIHKHVHLVGKRHLRTDTSAVGRRRLTSFHFSCVSCAGVVRVSWWKILETNKFYQTQNILFYEKYKLKFQFLDYIQMLFKSTLNSVVALITTDKIDINLLTHPLEVDFVLQLLDHCSKDAVLLLQLVDTYHVFLLTPTPFIPRLLGRLVVLLASLIVCLLVSKGFQLENTRLALCTRVTSCVISM